MIVECSGCRTKYNVDENKVPPGGVKVRCHKCGAIIFIKKEIPSAPEPPKPQVTIPPEPKVAAPPSPQIPEPSKPEVPPSAGIPEPPKPEIPPQPEPEIPKPPPVIPPSPQAENEVVSKPPTPPPGEMSEEDRKWHERARRLAKALASDLVLYNQEKVEQGLRDGTLAQLLGSEIRKSWEYYCQQIPKHIVESTDYFKEQLNKIVGKGREIFK